MSNMTMNGNLCLNLKKIIEDLELEKLINCSSNFKGNDITKHFLEEKERKEDICLRINYEIWSHNLNYTQSCK